MWKDFNIDEYAPSRSLRERPASASGSHTSNKENNSWDSKAATKRAGDTWSPIITIPKPFDMMVREEKKQKKKTKVRSLDLIVRELVLCDDKSLDLFIILERPVNHIWSTNQ